MSCAICMSCDRLIDTDDGDCGYQKEKPFGIKCSACLERDGQGIDDHGYIVDLDENGDPIPQEKHNAA